MAKLLNSMLQRRPPFCLASFLPNNSRLQIFRRKEKTLHTLIQGAGTYNSIGWIASRSLNLPLEFPLETTSNSLPLKEYTDGKLKFEMSMLEAFLPIFKKQVISFRAIKGVPAPQLPWAKETMSGDVKDQQSQQQRQRPHPATWELPFSGAMIAAVCCCLQLDVGICWICRWSGWTCVDLGGLTRPNNLVITRNRSREFGAMKSWKRLGVTGPKRSPLSTGGDFHPKRGGWSSESAPGVSNDHGVSETAGEKGWHRGINWIKIEVVEMVLVCISCWSTLGECLRKGQSVTSNQGRRGLWWHETFLLTTESRTWFSLFKVIF